MYAVSADLMKEIDRYTIEEIGIPSMVLMENAARCVVKHIIDKVSYIDKCSLLVVCGKGNNGGDGVCVARLLHEMGYDVTVYMVAHDDISGTNDEKKQMDIANKCGVKFADIMDLTKYDIIVDAIFGIGLTREIKGEYYDVIKAINDYKNDSSCSLRKLRRVAKLNNNVLMAFNSLGITFMSDGYKNLKDYQKTITRKKE